MSEIHFRSYFWPFQIDKQLYVFGEILIFVNLFYKMDAGGHLDVRKSRLVAFMAISDQYETIKQIIFTKFTLDHISGHFRSIQIFIIFFYKMAAGGHFGCLKITLDRISGHFRLIGHFGCPKFTFDVISGHFRSIRNFIYFFKFLTTWPPAAILDVRK